MSRSKKTSAGKSFLVHAQWDEESRSWWTDGEDIPGLTCQAASFEELADIVFDLAPDLLKANGATSPGQTIDVQLRVVAERSKTARLVA
jgi:hypothetical protein